MTRRINTGIGDVETVTTTLVSAVDLTGATIQVSLGSYSSPTAWITPDLVTLSTDHLTAAVTVTIGQGHYDPPAGAYWLWRRVVGGDASIDPNTRYVIDTSTGTVLGPATALITIGEVA